MGVEEYAPASAYRGLLPISPAKPRKAPERGLAYYLGPDVMGALNRSADLATALSPIDDYRYSADGFGKMLADDSDWLDRVAGFGEGILGAAMFASPAVTAALLDDATRAGIKAAAESRPARAVDDAMSWVDDQGRMFYRDQFGGIRVWHGSPHDFEKFRMSQIGTGEGAQAFGHGLYFAESPGVARSYRDQLSRPYLATADGQNIAEKYGDDVADIFERVGGDPDDMRATVTRLRGIVKRNLDDFGVSDVSELKSEYYGDLPSATIDASNRADRLESLLNSEDVKLVNTGHLYEAMLNAELEDFLDWDKPLSEQPKAVQDAFKPRIEALRKLGASIGKDPDGATLEQIAHPTVQLDDVDWNRGMRQQASDFMREAGIPGIKYFDATSRGWVPPKVVEGDGGFSVMWGNDPRPVDTFPTRAAAEEVAKQLDPRTRNYVVFDENLIEIVKKYGIAGAAALLGVSALDVEQAMAQGSQPQPQGLLTSEGMK